MIVKRHILAGVLTLLSSSIFALSSHITPYYSIRSQGLNTPRRLVGLVQQVFAVNKDTLFGTMAVALEYSRSFNENSINECLFGTKCCPQITISGSHTEDRGVDDWLADYFYLPTDFKSTVSFKPRIDNLLADFIFYIGLDDWVPGLYITAYAPLVHTRWNLNMCETVELKGTNSFAPGYFTPDTLQRNELLNNFSEYVSGDFIVGPIKQTFAGDDFTVTFQKLRNARIGSHEENQTRLADIRVALGYNYARLERFQAGISLQVAFPTGDRPEGEFFFEPIVGNGHHWELGVGLTIDGKPYVSQDQQRQIILYGDAKLYHLFSARQKRTFDLTNRPFSRYMLIERLGTPITNNLKGDGVTPSGQYQNEVLPVANLSNVSVNVSAGLQAELTAMATFVCDNFSWDVGYNFWARTCEKIKLFGTSPFDGAKWALKGDAQVFGYDRGALGDGPLVGAIALSATESKATITSGTNLVSGVSVADALKNPNIDNPQNATGDASGGASDNPLSAAPFENQITIQTSVNPIFLTSTDLNVCEKRTRGLSNKIFTHFSYAWQQRAPGWIPYIGIGGEVEFGSSSDDCNDCATRCIECINCSLSQWGIWLKGGLTF